MKIEIEDGFGFSDSFSQKLKKFLKEEFLKIIEMEVPLLYLGGKYFSSFSVNEIEFSGAFDNISLSWTSGESVRITALRWKSQTKLFYPADDVSNEEIEFELEGLPYFREHLQRQIPTRFKKHYLTGYRFIVELSALAIDVYVKVETEKKYFEDIAEILEEGRGYFNDSHEEKVHNIWPEKSRGNVFKTRIDLGSGGEEGLIYIINHLNKSSIPISKVCLSGVD